MAGPIYSNCHSNAVNLKKYYKQMFIELLREVA